MHRTHSGLWLLPIFDCHLHTHVPQVQCIEIGERKLRAKTNIIKHSNIPCIFQCLCFWPLFIRNSASLKFVWYLPCSQRHREKEIFYTFLIYLGWHTFHTYAGMCTRSLRELCVWCRCARKTQQPDCERKSNGKKRTHAGERRWKEWVMEEER